MSRVSGVGPGVPVAPGRAQPATSGGFTVAAETKVAEAAAAAVTQPVAPAAMLALQEAETETARNRKGHRHGAALLDALRQLQQELLGKPAETGPGIATLARLAASAPSVSDPELGQILSAIRLRARVELLRRGVETG